jgi:required for meiotic nuclear division protein 1
MSTKSLFSIAFLPLLRTTPNAPHMQKAFLCIQTRTKSFLRPPKPTYTSFVNTISSSSQINAIQENITALQMKKRPRKKRLGETEELDGNFNVTAFATAEEYDLEKLFVGLKLQNLYEPKKIFNSATDAQDVLHATAKYKVNHEPRHIFFFREGTVVLWNCSDLENSNILSFLKKFEQDGYHKTLVQQEMEQMTYNYVEDDLTKPQLKNGKFLLTRHEEENLLEKYTFSNAMSLSGWYSNFPTNLNIFLKLAKISVKLGIWEASLDKYVDSMEFVTEDLKKGNKIKMTRPEMLRKTGELFALRHLINLSSDLLDTPDFYWDREELESVYSLTCSYFSISKRTKVMNERLNHCVELADLISSNLNDIHHVRLEWMIIILIMVEVVFEIIHYADRFVG